jgi:hypothetical protein
MLLTPLQGLLDRRVLFFGGKGGVGKTTCAAAMALAASRAGRRVLLVSTDPAHSTSDVLERAIGPLPVELQPGLWGLEIDAATESARYVAEVKDRVRTLFGHSILDEAFKQIDLAASMPGAEEVALFDRMGELVLGDDARFDLIVFDTAPTGHTLRLVRMPELMEAWVRALTRSRRAMLGIEADDRQDPIDTVRAPPGGAGAAGGRPHDGLRARARSGAAADRRDRTGHRPARRHGRARRRPGREPRAPGRHGRSLPAGTTRPGARLSRGDRAAVRRPPARRGAAVPA